MTEKAADLPATNRRPGSPCPACGYQRDTPNHTYGCRPVQAVCVHSDGTEHESDGGLPCPAADHPRTCVGSTMSPHLTNGSCDCTCAICVDTEGRCICPMCPPSRCPDDRPADNNGGAA